MADSPYKSLMLALSGPSLSGLPGAKVPKVEDTSRGDPQAAAQYDAIAKAMSKSAVDSSPTSTIWGALSRPLAAVNQSVYANKANDQRQQYMQEQEQKQAQAQAASAAKEDRQFERQKELMELKAGIQRDLQASRSQYDLQAKREAYKLKFEQLKAAGIEPGTPEFNKGMFNIGSGDPTYGRSGGVFKGPDGRHYTVQFASDGSRKILPVETTGEGGQAISLTPSRGVTKVDTGTGTRVIDSSTGQDVRDINKNIADAEYQKKSGLNMAKLEASMPKIKASLASVDASNDNVIRAIDEALPRINNLTAGYGGALLSNMPATAARDVAGLIGTIRANSGFDKLQDMRNNSPTGGALGNVSELELKELQRTFADLGQDQTPERLRKNLLKVKEQVLLFKRLRHEAFQEQYAPILNRRGGAQAQPTPAAQSAGFSLPEGFSLERID